jgi:hypothetical protein
MSSWGNNDNAANAPYWAVNSTIVNAANTKINASAPTAANVAKLYANTTADVYTVGETIGLFALDNNEVAVDGNKGAHTGWILRTTGSGGRAGRVQEEVLVALANVNGDSDNQVYANVSISLTVTDLRSVVSGAANANTALFTVTPTLTGNTAANLTYQWQVNNNSGGSWVNMADGNAPQPGGLRKAGVTSATFQATPWNTTANNYVFRCIVTAADQGVSATSANGRILIS